MAPLSDQANQSVGWLPDLNAQANQEGPTEAEDDTSAVPEASGSYRAKWIWREYHPTLMSEIHNYDTWLT